MAVKHGSILNGHEVSQVLQCSYTTIKKLISDDRLRLTEWGRYLLVTGESVEAYLDEEIAKLSKMRKDARSVDIISKSGRNDRNSRRRDHG